jgi:hypothetical protein
MKLWTRTAATAGVVAALTAVDASGASVAKAYRVLRVNDAKAFSHAPGPFLTAPRACVPDAPPIPGVTIPLAPELFGDGFDPSLWDEISVAGDGRLLAYASAVSSVGIPGSPKQIVLTAGAKGAVSKRIDVVATQDDQPCVRYDLFGHRCAFRSAGAAGAAPSNIQLYTFTTADAVADPTTAAKTEAVTNLTGTDTAFDPALAAAVRRKSVGGGLHHTDRDAHIAFVSTGDLAGKNPDNLEQLFLWEELGKTFTQITRHTDATAHVNRPAIALGGDLIVFESTADLDPASVDPLDATRVGNPNHVRQLFRWRRGKGLDQITWADGDCFSPRFDPTGRWVLFASRGDPITGGNPEHNLEIFEWFGPARPALRLRQMTQTAEGDSAFPRPTARRGVFVFYSTAHPPKALPGSSTVPAFGEGSHECSPSALLYVRDQAHVTLLEGKLDVENALRLVPSRTSAQQTPVFVGPPAVGLSALKVYFATNDYALNPPLPKGSTAPTDETSLFLVYIAIATR